MGCIINSLLRISGTAFIIAFIIKLFLQEFGCRKINILL